MSKLNKLIRDKASIEALKDDLDKNRHNKNYVNLIDVFGMTALTWACGKGYTEAVKLLLENGANVNLVDTYDRTALMRACGNGYTEAVKLLLEANANVNIANEDGDTALKIAEQYGFTEIIELLNNFKEKKTNSEAPWLEGDWFVREDDLSSMLVNSVGLGGWRITYNHQMMSIGFACYRLDEWKNFTDDEISAMDKDALAWWKKWKEPLFNIIELSLKGEEHEKISN